MGEADESETWSGEARGEARGVETVAPWGANARAETRETLREGRDARVGDGVARARVLSTAISAPHGRTRSWFRRRGKGGARTRVARAERDAALGGDGRGGGDADGSDGGGHLDCGELRRGSR